MRKYCWLFACLVSLAQLSTAKIYQLPESFNPVLENERTIYSEPGDKLIDVAKRHHVTANHLKLENPKLKNKPKPWTKLKKPKVLIPNAPMQGIVVDLSDRLLFYYPPEKREVWVFPIAIGQQGWETPLGKTSVVDKKKDPVWRVPKSIKRKMAKKGIHLPNVVAAGPKNPLGTHAIRLAIGKGSILIHGTSKPNSIGSNSSHGCIRMLNEHVALLFPEVDKGMPVLITDDKNTLAKKSSIDDEIERELLVELDYVEDETTAEPKPIYTRTTAKSKPIPKITKPKIIKPKPNHSKNKKIIAKPKHVIPQKTIKAKPTMSKPSIKKPAPAKQKAKKVLLPIKDHFPEEHNEQHVSAEKIMYPQ